MISRSSTEFSTVYTVMTKSQNICASVDQKDLDVAFDLAIYSKAKQSMTPSFAWVVFTLL